MRQDQLSNLPIIILHDILSRLPEKDAVRTSVLSKTWAQTWFTFPILSFSDTKILGRRLPYLSNSKNISPFLDNVERTLFRFHNQGLAIEQFKLNMNYYDIYHVSKDVDLWLKLAIECGVEVLELHRSRCVYEQHYILPTNILEGKSLTKLMLKGKIKVDLSLLNKSMKIFSLQVLKLESILLEDEHAIKHFISCCPLIEYITLSWCEYPDDKGFLNLLKSVGMRGLPKLKRLYVHGIQEVYVESPRLENLDYCSRCDPLEKMDFSKCKNLKELYLTSLRSTVITNKWFCELFANYPFLHSLKLENCVMSRRILISSVQLKVLKLLDCLSLKEVNIDAPNMLSFGYAHDSKLIVKSLSFLRFSSQLKVYVWNYSSYVDFYNLREFIQNITPKIVLPSVSLCIQESTKTLNPVLFQVSSPPPNIPYLVIRVVPINGAMYLPIVYDLLSSCCPATVFIYTSFGLGLTESCKAFAKVFYETLKGKKVDKCFCSSSNSKCWWHDLKDVKVSISMNNDENNVDFKTMLDALSFDCLVDGYITFRLEF